MRARGLKQPVYSCIYDIFLSRPMRARGLKRALASIRKPVELSRPMRARGLKQIDSQYLNHSKASRAPCGRVD